MENSGDDYRLSIDPIVNQVAEATEPDSKLAEVSRRLGYRHATVGKIGQGIESLHQSGTGPSRGGRTFVDKELDEASEVITCIRR